MSRIGGVKALIIDGETVKCKGDVETNLGEPKRSSVLGTDGTVHGTTEEAQPASVKGTITLDQATDRRKIVTAQDVTVQVEGGDGTVFTGHLMTFVGEGTKNSKENEMEILFEGPGPADEVKA